MKILKLTKGIRKYIIIMTIFSIVQVISELYLPNIMSDIVDIGISNSDKIFITKQTLLMIVFTLSALISNIIVVYATSKFSNYFGYNIRDSLYRKINSFSKKEIDEFGASTLINRSTNNVSNITSTFSYGLRIIIFAPIMAIGAAFMCYKKASILSPIVVSALILLSLGLIIIFSIVYPKFEIAQKLMDKINASAREILSGLRIIKSFNKQEYFKKRFDKVNEENKRLNVFLNKILYLIQPMILLIINISTILIVYVSIGFISSKQLEIGSMMAFIQYLATILVSFLMLLVIILNIPRVMVSFKRINEILNVTPSIKNSGNIKLKTLESIEFKNVYFRYENAHRDMLKNISFKIVKGEFVGIIGSSGSGKTTIANLLLRHIDASSGEILINGIDIKEYNIESLRNLFAYTPQKTSLFIGSIKENLSFGNKYNLSDLNAAVASAHIDDFIIKNEEGYDYLVGQSAINLSGGQKQRMSIARALLSKGECLLLDDSFSAVDNITDKKIMRDIINEYRDKMIILITQKVSSIKDCDKIIVIEEGKIDDIGTYKELQKNSDIFNEFIVSVKREV